MSDERKLLEISGLRVYYYTAEGVVKAVDGVDLDMEREPLGLVGESGCGKSTLGLSILGLVSAPGKIVSGSISFQGQDLTKKTNEELRKIRGASISMVFQNPLSSFNPVFRVGDQIGEAIELHQGVPRAEVQKLVVESLDRVGIADAKTMARHYPHEYSGGMRQRAMIAMALSCQPTLLIADEPTSALDVTIQAQVLELMKEIRKKHGLSILLITHELGLVAELCDKVAIMYSGKIVEQSDVVTIFTKPKHPYTFALLKSVPGLETVVESFHVIKGNVPSLVEPPRGCRFHPRCDCAIDKCAATEPGLVEVAPGHRVACIRAEELELYTK